MRISGTEPSSVFLNQTKLFEELKKWCPKSTETSWSQKGWCNKPTKLQFQSILNTGNFDALQTLELELGFMCPRGLTGPPAVTLTK